MAEPRECADVPVSGVLGREGERRHVGKVTCKRLGYGNGVINVPGVRAAGTRSRSDCDSGCGICTRRMAPPPRTSRLERTGATPTAAGHEGPR